MPGSKSPPATPTHVALLRGINVGGKHMIPMADLARMFTGAGCESVTTYIQSGNVLVAASDELAARLPTLVGSSIQRKFGFTPDIILRTAGEIRRVARAHPYLTADADPALFHVGFLGKAPAASLIKALDPNRSPGDRFVVRGCELFVHYGAGAGKTRLTSAYFDSKLQTTSTFRNWRTVLKLAELMRGTSSVVIARS